MKIFDFEIPKLTETPNFNLVSGSYTPCTHSMLGEGVSYKRLNKLNIVEVMT